MTIEFTIFQLIPLGLICLTIYLFWIKYNKMGIFCLIIGIISIIAMPVKVVQSNMSRFEDIDSKFNNINPRVIVPEIDFNDFQQSELNKLKESSKNESI